MDGRFALLAISATIGGENDADIGLWNVLLSSCRGEVADSADTGRKASPLLGEAGRTGDGGLMRTGESGRDVLVEVDGEGD